MTASIASGQWLEKNIYLPDQYSGLQGPYVVEYVPTVDKVYVGGSLGATVVVLDGATDRRVARVAVSGSVADLCYNATSDKVYATNEDRGCVSIIDPQCDSVIATVEVGETPGALCWNSRVNKVYCANYHDGTVTVIDGAGDSVIATVEVGGYPSALCYDSLDDKLYCGVQVTNVVAVLDGTCDTLLATIPVGDDPVALCHNPADGKVYCANSDSNNVSVIDAMSDTTIATVHLLGYHNPLALFYCAANSSVYCVCDFPHGRIMVIDGESDSIVAQVPLGDSPYALCYNPQTSRMFCSNRTSRTVSVIDCVRNGQLAQIPNVGSAPSGICINPSRNRVYCACEFSDEVAVIDGATNQLAGLVETGRRPAALAFSTTSGKLYSANRHGRYGDWPSSTVTAVLTGSDSIVATVQVGYWAAALCWNSLGDKIYCTNGSSNSVSVISCASDSVLRSTRVGAFPTALCYNSTDNKIYCANYDSGSVSVIDGSTDLVVRTVRTGGTPAAFCYNAADDKVYSANGGAGTVSVIDGRADSVIVSVAVDGTPAALCWNDVNDMVYCVNSGIAPTVSVIDGVTNTNVHTISLSGTGAGAVCLNPRSNRLYCATTLSRSPWHAIQIISCVTNQVEDAVPGVDAALLTYNPFNNKVYCASWPGIVAIDCFTDTVCASVATGDGPDAILVDPTRNVVYVANFSSSSVSIVTDTVLGVDDRSLISVGHPPEAATVVRRVLVVPLASGDGRVANCDLLDISGRKVLDLCPGPNDIRHLAPGVYFVRGAQAQAVSKIVLTR